MTNNALPKNPIVLVHPTGVAGDTMSSLEDALGSRRKVYAYSRLGWDGGPIAPKNNYYEIQGQQLIEVIQRLTTPVELFAWSSGGIVALHAALTAPHLITRLHLYEVPLWSSRDNDRKRALRFISMLTWSWLQRDERSKTAFWNMVSELTDGPTGFERLPTETRQLLLRQTGPLIREVLAGTGEELRGRLEQITIPVSVLVGAASSHASHAAADRLVAAFRSSERHDLSDADHLAPITMPSVVAAAILQSSDSV
jgi:pimeloyl-ACP methyl ester carboxylesterase